MFHLIISWSSMLRMTALGTLPCDLNDPSTLYFVGCQPAHMYSEGSKRDALRFTRGDQSAADRVLDRARLAIATAEDEGRIVWREREVYTAEDDLAEHARLNAMLERNGAPQLPTPAGALTLPALVDLATQTEGLRVVWYE